MHTIGKVTEAIINRSPFLREALSEDLINVSALARKIRFEVEEIVGKEIKEGAIVMAIKRMSPSKYQQIDIKIKNVIGELGDFLVRSDLETFTFENSESLTKKQADLMNILSRKRDVFYTVCNGLNETTIITSKLMRNEVLNVFSSEKSVNHNKDLASITVKLPKMNVEISGIYYYILKHLAWEGINLREVVSTTTEFTVIVDSKDIDQAFSVLMQLKKKELVKVN